MQIRACSFIKRDKNSIRLGIHNYTKITRYLVVILFGTYILTFYFLIVKKYVIDCSEHRICKDKSKEKTDRKRIGL